MGDLVGGKGEHSLVGDGGRGSTPWWGVGGGGALLRGSKRMAKSLVLIYECCN